MPKLWSETIETHRQAVRETILEATAGLAAQHGLLNVTMSQVAEAAGIGRATLYKYFSSVEEILRAWHEHRIGGHLDLLTEIAERDTPAIHRLRAMLAAYVQIQRDRTEHGSRPHGRQLDAFLHRDDALEPAGRRLRALLVTVLAAAAEERQVRTDIPIDELAGFCLHAANAAGSAESLRAADRLVAMILDGLRPD